MRRAARRARGRGFTIVELMVAVLISAILVGMILSIFSRMSLAFRSQQGVAELQQTLAAASAVIDRETRAAGFGMSEGFFVAGDTALHQPIEIIDDADGFGPDELKMYAGDAGATAIPGFGTQAITDPLAYVDVDSVDNFAPGDLALLSVYDSGGKHTYACVVQIARITGNRFDLETAAPWGTATNSQCDDVRKKAAAKIIMYRFRARAFRIDPTRLDLAILQMSPSGGLIADDWQDLGIGFTDLQLASRWFDPPEPANLTPADDIDVDGDGDKAHEWYSGADQETYSAPLAGSADYVTQNYTTPWRPLITELRVSLAVRTHARIDSVPSSKTPAFIDTAKPDNNQIGNRDSFLLDGVPDAARPDELKGDHVYRYITFGSDLRNLSVGVDQ